MAILLGWRWHKPRRSTALFRVPGSRRACVPWQRKPALHIPPASVRDVRRQPIIPKPPDVPRGTVYVIVEECKGCGLCIDFCPREVLVFSNGTNAKGHHYPVVVKEGECANCQMCTLICSDFAIFSTPALQALQASALEAAE